MLLTILLQLCYDWRLLIVSLHSLWRAWRDRKRVHSSGRCCQQTFDPQSINYLAKMGYNFLYGLWKYSWDADCELFLKILQEETKEDVYTQQIQLQAST